MAGKESAQRLLTTRLNVREAEAALKMYMNRHEGLQGMGRLVISSKITSCNTSATSTLFEKVW
jgi:hypothetical protein